MSLNKIFASLQCHCIRSRFCVWLPHINIILVNSLLDLFVHNLYQCIRSKFCVWLSPINIILVNSLLDLFVHNLCQCIRSKFCVWLSPINIILVNSLLDLFVQVCSQRLPLPESVDVISATVAAGHLSSASIYPACFAPYVLVTACTDGDVRFWRCNLSEVVSGSLGNRQHPNSIHMTNYEFTLDDRQRRHRPSVTTLQRFQQPDIAYDFQEWEMLNVRRPESAITIPGEYIYICVCCIVWYESNIKLSTLLQIITVVTICAGRTETITEIWVN